jgi:ribose-phosphate pyrophosphokinase
MTSVSRFNTEETAAERVLPDAARQSATISEPIRPAVPAVPAILFAASGSRALAAIIERECGLGFGQCTTERFPDGEVAVSLDEPVRGREVIILQATCAPVNDHLVELLAFVDACRRAAAERIVAVIPYFGYARSDRRAGRRTPITGSLVASLLQTAGVDHVVMIDVHTPAIEGFFHVPVDNITAAPLLAAALRDQLTRDAVVVAPDLGAIRLANRYALLLDLPTAVCHKQRISATEVSVNRITGDVKGRPCVIVDDMIATGSTIEESVRALRHAGALPEITVVATHAVFVAGALQKMADAGVRHLVITDTIAAPTSPIPSLPPMTVSVAPLLASAIHRLLEGGSLRELA